MDSLENIKINYQDSLSFFDSELFAQVQMAGIFSDSKTFADAKPKSPYPEITSEYRKLRNNNGFDLGLFVNKYFDLPEIKEIKSSHKEETAAQQIEYLWKLLRRDKDTIAPGSLIPLLHNYSVPGGRFREIYYWDSYFTSLGLISSNKSNEVWAMIRNFIHLQSVIGFIPNGNRSYYHGRSQPPVLALLISLLEDSEYFQQSLPDLIKALESEYRFWMTGSESLNEKITSCKRVVRMKDGAILNRYWDDEAKPRPESYAEDIEIARTLSVDKRAAFYRNIRAACESGWDFSCRWFGLGKELVDIKTTDILPIDLNCLLFNLELKLSEYYKIQHNEKQSQCYENKSKARKVAINKYFWHPELGFYNDYHLDMDQTASVMSLAGVVPLFVKIATKKRATVVKHKLENSFLKAGGLVTSLGNSNQQWDSPNGWAPLQWLSVVGLRNYGYHSMAIEVANRWVTMVENEFKNSGHFMEKYDVCNINNLAQGGEYEVQEGFGWTNGVTQALYQMSDD